ncbi:MAG: acyl-CoA dehydrogenase family protein [Steroidobacteraceae bacterium]|jgi:alkylation response protein AidB-like acyl-CoA dehydrogenase|nr:acyl-CoA dehydrogenase family protein [Steroidobacteraceae bacterium]
MDLELSQEQAQVRDAARRFLERECSPSLVRRVREGAPSHPQALWAGMAEQGWLTLPFEEACGGLAAGWVTLAVVVEELGRACDPTPFIDCVVNCGGLIQDLGGDVQKQRWLTALTRGELLVSLALLESPADPNPERIETRLEAEGTGFRVSGRKLFVERAADADLLLVAARETASGRVRLALVAPRTAGVELVRLRSLAHPHLYEVRLEGVAIEGGQVLGEPIDAASALQAAIRRAAALQSAAAVGGAQRVLEMAVAHARERHQFGKPIGSFQAVQHMLADVWAEVETARLAAYEAITELEFGGNAVEEKAAIARCASSQCFVRTCLTAHQIFGGMGFMWETDLHLWTRKAKEIEFACGGVRLWRRRLAELL